MSTETGLDPAGPTLSHDFSDFSTLGGALPFSEVCMVVGVFQGVSRVFPEV